MRTPCPYCFGRGQIADTGAVLSYFGISQTKTCPSCGGSGMVDAADLAEHMAKQKYTTLTAKPMTETTIMRKPADAK